MRRPVRHGFPGHAMADVLLGRESELELVKEAIAPGGAALILGGKGIGKSALLAAAHRAALAAGSGAGLAAASERTEATLAQLLESLGAPAGPGVLGARALRGRLIRWCSDRRSAIFLDDADRANAGLLRALRHVVLETSTAVVVAARTGPADPPDRLRHAVFAGTREVRLGPLSLRAARALAIAHLGADGPLAAEIVRESGRIPAAIVEMARRHREPRYLFDGRISWALVLADLRVENRI
jgi:hypothetical protein